MDGDGVANLDGAREGGLGLDRLVVLPALLVRQVQRVGIGSLRDKVQQLWQCIGNCAKENTVHMQATAMAISSDKHVRLFYATA